MSRSLAPTDLKALLKRLAEDERDAALLLSEVEERLRLFTDQEQPAYQNWIRTELGPMLSSIEELYERIHERRLLARTIDRLVRKDRLDPRVALYIALERSEVHDRSPEGEEGDSGEGDSDGNDKSNDDDDEDSEEGSSSQKKRGHHDRDEIDARRRAKVEAKRAARKEEKKARKEEQRQQKEAAKNGGRFSKKNSQTTEFSDRPSGDDGDAAGASRSRVADRLVTLYRSLARKLHPDSPVAIKTLPPKRVLTIWLEVQSAYETKNIERLIALEAWTENLSGDDLGSREAMSLSDRYERLHLLRKSCLKLEKRMADLSLHPAWDFKHTKTQARRKLKHSAARELEDELASAQELLDQLDDFIESIGSPKAPGKKR